MVELTKYGRQTNYRIPPESTGAPIAHNEHWYFLVEGDVDVTHPAGEFELTTGARGDVHTAQAYSSGYRLLVTPHMDSQIGGFQVNEDITLTYPDGHVVVATLKEWSAVLLPVTGVINPNAPSNFLAIDASGSAHVRFTEGEPSFDAYGLMRMTQPHALATHFFRYDAKPNDFQKKTTGTADVSHIQYGAAIALDVDIGATDAVSYTANHYVRFVPGVGQSVTITSMCGDTGTANNIRRWGYYDDEVGLFFELSNGILHVCIRSTYQGVTTDTKVAQSLWNIDRVDGSGSRSNPSGMNLAVNKHNIYFIDMQLRGGAIRFGVFHETGERTVVHTFERTNKSSILPPFNAVSLPLRFENFNSGGAGASPSRLYITSAAIFRDGPIIPDALNNNSLPGSWVIPAPITVTGSSETFVAGFRAGALLNGIANRKLIVPNKLIYYSDKPVQVVIKAGTVLNTGTWNAISAGSGAEVCLNGTILAAPYAGKQVSISFVNGSVESEVSENFNSFSNSLHTYADGTAGMAYTMWVKPLNPADSVTFTVGINWIEN